MDLQNKLFEACRVDDLEQIRKLITEGVDPKKVKTRRWTVDDHDVGLEQATKDRNESLVRVVTFVL